MKINNVNGRYEFKYHRKWYHAAFETKYSTLVIRRGHGRFSRVQHLLQSLVVDLIMNNVSLLDDPLAWEPDSSVGIMVNDSGDEYKAEDILLIKRATP